MKPAPFSRSLAIVAALSTALSSGMSFMAAAAASGADHYRSRGKGRGRTSSVSKRHGNLGKSYPFSSAKQDAKAAARQHMIVTRSGFEIMQTRSARDIANRDQDDRLAA